MRAGRATGKAMRLVVAGLVALSLGIATGRGLVEASSGSGTRDGAASATRTQAAP